MNIQQSYVTLLKKIKIKGLNCRFTHLITVNMEKDFFTKY
jgi:hypothetical protein